MMLASSGNIVWLWTKMRYKEPVNVFHNKKQACAPAPACFYTLFFDGKTDFGKLCFEILF